MATIALIWELGGGFGHVKHLLPLYNALQHSPMHCAKLIVKSPHKFGIFADIDPQDIILAPRFNPDKRNQSTLHFADILGNVGFAEYYDLQAKVNAWILHFTALKVALVVCDHSPSALLAARILNIPVVTLGGAFFVPPNIPECPWLLPEAILEEQAKTIARKREQQILKNINKVLSSYKQANFSHIGELFSQASHFFVEIPQMDHYFQLRTDNHQYIGSLNSGTTITTEDTAELLSQLEQFCNSTHKTFFVYLKSHTPYCKSFLQAVAKLNEYRWVIFLDDSKKRMALPEWQHCWFSRSPLPIQKLSPQLNGIFCHAGRGTILDALSHNIGLCLMPEQLEQQVMTQNLCKAKLAIHLPTQFSSNTLQEAINVMEQHQLMAQNRQVVAKQISELQSSEPKTEHTSLQTILSTIEEKLND